MHLHMFWGPGRVAYMCVHTYIYIYIAPRVLIMLVLGPLGLRVALFLKPCVEGASGERSPVQRLYHKFGLQSV